MQSLVFKLIGFRLRLVGALLFLGLGLGSAQALTVAEQVESAGRPNSQHSAARIWYVGVALHYNSTAFWGDVLGIESALRRLDPDLVSVKLGNGKLEKEWPRATFANFKTAVEEVAKAAKQDDLFVLAVSSHGGPYYLEAGTSASGLWGLREKEFREILKPFDERRTLVLVASCYSGSWTEVLRAPKRVIVASSQRNQKSDGCAPGATATTFIRAWVSEFKPGQSLRHLMYLTETRMENLNHQRPMIWVSDDMRAFAREPMNAWRLHMPK
jgi:hypothetical protein